MRVIEELLRIWELFWTGLGGTTLFGKSAPMGWENLKPIPVINVGYMGSSSTGKPKMWPHSDAYGFPPRVQFKNYTGLYLQEITGAGVNIGNNGSKTKGNIIVPPTATLTIGGVTMAAPGVSVVLPVEFTNAVAVSSGVASSWFIWCYERAEILSNTTARS